MQYNRIIYPNGASIVLVGGEWVPLFAGGVDNTVLNAGSGGDTIATDDIGGVKYQIVKAAFGALDTATLVTTGVGLPTDPLDRAARDMGKIDIAMGQGAHDAAGSGFDPVAIAGYASAAAPADVSADTDVTRAWFLRNGAQATVVTAAGALIGGDAANGLDVDVTRVTGTVTISGTVTANAGTNLNTSSLALDSTLTNQQITDNAAFTDGTTKLAMAGYIFDDVAGTSLTENDAAAARVNANRALVSTIEDGATRARYATVTASNALKVDGSAVTQPVSGTVSITSNSAVNVAQVAGTNTVTAGVSGLIAVGGNVANAVAATSNPVPVGGIFTTTPATLTTGQTATLQFTAAQNAKCELTTVQGTAIDVNSGNKSAGTVRVVLATDQPALTNKLLVTPDSVALPANQSCNTAQFGGTNVSTGTGAGGAGIPRVTVSNDSTLGLVPVTSGGCSINHLISAATTNATNVKASAGQVYGWTIFNTNAAIRYVKLHNTAGAPTAGTGVVYTIGVPATGGNNITLPTGLAFSTGIAFTTVTGVADADTVAVGASDLAIDIHFK